MHIKTVKSILKNPANEIAEEMEFDLHLKRFTFSDYAYTIIYSGIYECDLTDIMKNFIQPQTYDDMPVRSGERS